MGRPQKYRGVRQRHWGSWVSEIRHPQLKTRVWLGTFETAEDAAHAYDEAARLMCGAKARTNFPYDPHASKGPKSQLLSATLTAKLQRWYLQSLQPDAQQGKKSSSRMSQSSLPCLCQLKHAEQSNLGSCQNQISSSQPLESNLVRIEHFDDNADSFQAQPQPASSSDSCISEEDKFAAEMIEELLSWQTSSQFYGSFNSPTMSDSGSSSPCSVLTASGY
ncbi:ethylene-responsive transcription factor WIN1 [Physcomitrium patens]|uniref:AP2-like ethylene-responsive transcription factor n=1 Tax=Physcomitrium patens TaxID=3218 RepID=A0A2K1L9X8_PHYPA|nr:ethylene-responsive transcription factor ERF003-like [Physcomitrium patens]PNR62828.1 hypothetical protein PHYPA_001252 [Physcomitrium patens]BBA85541.1 AP2-like ethylene-responsive transcription factor [Physcomitrium patens]|eukprot:XP_024371967.1 ethylene-responsive transcription factor ERF003-like [Physcomitrella patens]